MATETPMKVIVDCATGQESIVPLTAAELKQREADRLAWETAEAERKAAEAKKEADRLAGIETLKTLGLTDDQITALVG